MKSEESVKLTINKYWIVAIFVISIISFCTFEILLLGAEKPWQIGILKLFSCLSQITFSILGVSFLVEYSTLRKTSKKSMEEMKNSIVNHTAQVEYIKENYSKDMRRQLLLMSYMKDINSISTIDNSEKSSMLSFEKIIEELISCVYYDKDDTTTIYEFFDDYISKKVNRKVVVKNLYNSDYTFMARSSFNNIVLNGQFVDSFSLTRLNINGVDINEDNLNKYLIEDSPFGNDTTYTQHKTICVSTNCAKETHIDYSIELKLPIDDKQSLITTTVPVRDFNHTIILKKNSKLNDADINVFSLAKAIKLENEMFVSKIKSDDDKMKIFGIESSTWLFPGDGYNILFK